MRRRRDRGNVTGRLCAIAGMLGGIWILLFMANLHLKSISVDVRRLADAVAVYAAPAEPAEAPGD